MRQPGLEGERYESDTRVVALAVVASLCAHGVLLFTLSEFRNASMKMIESHPIVARLTTEQLHTKDGAADSSSQSTARQEERAVRPRPAKPAPREKPAEPKAAPVAKVPPLAQENPPPDAMPQSRPLEPKSQEASGSTKAESAPPAAIAASPSQSGSEGINRKVYLQYRCAMLDQVKRFMRYPRAAIDNNWTGNVTVRLVLGSNGEIASLTVQQSSGYKMLDQEALESVRKSKRRSVIPASIVGTSSGTCKSRTESLRNSSREYP